jgi:peptidyl-prolyl cis-trans isomerase SurA
MSRALQLLYRAVIGIVAAHLLAGAAAAAKLDHIVAVVNDDVILESELERQMTRVSSELSQRGTPMPPRHIFERQVLERLILTRIQLQEAELGGIRVDDERLNQTIRRIADDNQVSLEEFRRILESDGYSFVQFREDIRSEIIISQLRQRQVDNRIIVTDREIDNYLANQEQQGNIDSEYHLAHILIAIPAGADANQIEALRAKAEDAVQRARSGADFSLLAAEMSDGQGALEGGDLGWRKADRLPSLFAPFAKNMNPGEISDIIESPNGYHIVKLLDRRAGEKIMIPQTKARHILITPNELVSEDDAITRLEQIKIRLDGGADFAELARAHSDDRGSALKGGDLGWVSPGDLVPEFEEVMTQLTLNETSRPFKSRFGWHVVQVLERRKYDGTDAVIRSKAREAIRQRKSEEELQTWLQRLRDEAYVEFRLAGGE